MYDSASDEEWHPEAKNYSLRNRKQDLCKTYIVCPWGNGN